VYDGIWHLEELSAPYIDSSATKRNGSGGNVAVAGKLGAAHRFEGAGASIISIPSMVLPATYTVSAWVASEVPTQDPNQAVNFLNIADSMTLRIRQTAQVEARAYHHCGGDWPSYDFSGALLVTRTKWSLLAMTFQNSQISLYIDGHLDGSGPTSAGVASATGVSYLGGANPGCNYENIRSLKGTLDEVRVAFRVLTPAFLASEYKNQADPAAFAVFGPEELRP
jgi:Concanavalin A-like lectin/glucanases superfamily